MAAYAGRGLHGQTVETIARRILTGEIEEGATIDVDAVGAELQVSRTVLREALKVLAAKGLIGARQKRGTFVRPRVDWNLLDGDIIRWQLSGRADAGFLEALTEVRGMVEPAAAHLAATRRTGADLEVLEAALAAMTTAAGDQAVEADLAFHRALLAATHNEVLQRMEVVLVTGLAERDRLVHGTDDPDDPVPVHRPVLEAVRAGDPEAAEAAMRALLEKSTRDLDRATRGRQVDGTTSHDPGGLR